MTDSQWADLPIIYGTPRYGTLLDDNAAFRARRERDAFMDRMDVRCGTTSAWVRDPDDPNGDGEWHNLVVSRGDDETRVYVDGVEQMDDSLIRRWLGKTDNDRGRNRRGLIMARWALYVEGEVQRRGYATTMADLYQTPGVCVDDLEWMQREITYLYHPETGTRRHRTRVYGPVARDLQL